MKAFLLGFSLSLSVCISGAVAQNMEYPPEGETIVYKGITLVGTTYAKRSNDKFFRYAKIGIDMAQSLPKEKWNKTSLIKKIVYDPPSPERKYKPREDQKLGYYWIKDPVVFPAPVYLFTNTRSLSGLHFAMMMVEQSILAHHHRIASIVLRYGDDLDKGIVPANSQELMDNFDDVVRMANRLKTDPKSGLLGNDHCEGGFALYKAHEILHPDKDLLLTLRRVLSDNGCL